MKNIPAETADKDKDLTEQAVETPEGAEYGGTETEAPAEPADAPDLTDEKKIIPGKHAKAKENLSVAWTFISTFIVACIVIAALGLVVVKVGL